MSEDSIKNINKSKKVINYYDDDEKWGFLDYDKNWWRILFVKINNFFGWFLW